MSIASEIQRIKNNIANAYTKIGSKGGTLPSAQNSANLVTTIDSISGSNGDGILEKIFKDIVAGNNPVNTSQLSTIENQISGFLLI